MINGVTINFNKEDNNYFENEFDGNIDRDLLIISLLETVNDVCKHYGLDTNEQLNKYIKMGSIDDYCSPEAKEKMVQYESPYFKELREGGNDEI